MSVTILLTTNKKLYTGVRLVPTSVTLNGLVLALVLLYFTEFDSFAGLLRHSGRRSEEVIDIIHLSAEYHLPLLAKTDPPCSSVSLR